MTVGVSGNSYIKFQSTLPYGSDFTTTFKVAKLHISIHAPSRERRQFQITLLARAIFQSTLPHGSDLLVLLLAVILLNFNPRSLTGATMLDSRTAAGAAISIHAPSRERRYHLCLRLQITHISIHAPLRERHHKLPIGSFATSNFNPRSLAGATNPANLLPFIQDISIHAPLRERPAVWLTVPTLTQFQSTLPCGSDYRYSLAF